MKKIDMVDYAEKLFLNNDLKEIMKKTKNYRVWKN